MTVVAPSKRWMSSWILWSFGYAILQWTSESSCRIGAFAFQVSSPQLQRRSPRLLLGRLPSQFKFHANRTSRKITSSNSDNKGDGDVDYYLTSLQESYGETSRRYRRSYFTSDDWLRHRRPDRFLTGLLSIRKSGIAQQLLKEVTLIASTSLLVVLWNALSVEGYDDFSFVHHHGAAVLPLLRLPVEPFTLSSPALGLLLVFRTNACYSRWKDARKAWGGVINSSRTVLRLASVWTTTGDGCSPQNVQHVADCVYAFARSLQRRLLSAAEDQQAYQEDLTKYLDRDFAETLLAARHGPTRALYELTTAIQAVNLDLIRQSQVERSVSDLCDNLGACERIFTSPVPLFYARHTERFIAGWLMLLPLALYSSFALSWNHWGVIPVSVALAFFLFGIEEIAVQLEEPFSILPLQTMVEGIRQSAEEHVAWYCEQHPNNSYDDAIAADD